MTGPDRITIRRPDDWHLHLRDGAMLASVLPHSMAQFARAIVMPNLVAPVTTPEMAVAYRARITAALNGVDFTPLMTCYLTDATDPALLAQGHKDSVFTAAKLYPAHATTNSAQGVSDISKIDTVLDKMAEIGMPLLVHGEVTDPAVDIFDREAVFIERVLIPTLKRHPRLKVVMEHITTEEAASFVLGSGANVAATVTPHHLVINRNSLFAGGLRPHAYCLPVAKREKHRLALRKAVASGSSKLFIGTDSAPHAREAKESGCGCAGIFCAPTALEVYANVFAEEGALAHFEAFASLNGAAFYGLPPNEGTVTLKRQSWTVPESLPAADTTVVPFMAGHTLSWKMAERVGS